MPTVSLTQLSHTLSSFTAAEQVLPRLKLGKKKIHAKIDWMMTDRKSLDKERRIPCTVQASISCWKFRVVVVVVVFALCRVLQRPDTVVHDEPLYAHFLRTHEEKETPRPYREQVFKEQVSGNIDCMEVKTDWYLISSTCGWSNCGCVFSFTSRSSRPYYAALGRYPSTTWVFQLMNTSYTGHQQFYRHAYVWPVRETENLRELSKAVAVHYVCWILGRYWQYPVCNTVHAQYEFGSPILFCVMSSITSIAFRKQGLSAVLAGQLLGCLSVASMNFEIVGHISSITHQRNSWQYWLSSSTMVCI